MKTGRPEKIRVSHPLWMPAADYYFLSAALAIGVFFLLWAILTDANEQNPWLPSGIVASALAIGSVIIREIILRRKRRQIAEAAQLLDRTILSVKARKGAVSPRLTLEQNAALLAEIKRKSDAANVLARIAASHREVYELCEAYLRAAEAELPAIRPGSPRIAAIRKGIDYAGRLHRYHMLKWAEIESREFTQRAAASETPAARLLETKRALGVIRTALGHYPGDSALLDSQRVLQEAVSALEVKSLIKRAERSADRQRFNMALKHYKNALTIIGESNLPDQERNEITMEIQARIERLNELC
jgi:hypothetical protein